MLLQDRDCERLFPTSEAQHLRATPQLLQVLKILNLELNYFPQCTWDIRETNSKFLSPNDLLMRSSFLIDSNSALKDTLR